MLLIAEIWWRKIHRHDHNHVHDHHDNIHHHHHDCHDDDDDDDSSGIAVWPALAHLCRYNSRPTIKENSYRDDDDSYSYDVDDSYSDCFDGNNCFDGSSTLHQLVGPLGPLK